MRKRVLGVCEICGGEATCNDHDHVSGLLRGKLCDKCNRGGGFFNDDPMLMERAVIYYRKALSQELYDDMRKARQRQWRHDNPDKARVWESIDSRKLDRHLLPRTR